VADWIGVIQTAIPVGGLMIFFWPMRKYIDDKKLHDWLSRVRGRAALKTPMGEAAIEVVEQQASSNNPATTGLPTEATEGGPNIPATATAESTMAPPQRAAVHIVENELRLHVDLLSQDERVPILLRALAETRVRAGHEFVYNRIFGSQILGLKALNQRGAISRADAIKEFQPLKAQYPEAYEKYDFDDWVGWLQRMNLVSYSDGTYQITPIGRDFLVYMAEQGLLENKQL